MKKVKKSLRVKIDPKQLFRLRDIVHQVEVASAEANDGYLGRQDKSDKTSNEAFVADTAMVFIVDSYKDFVPQDRKLWRKFAKKGAWDKAQRVAKAMTELLEALR